MKTSSVLFASLVLLAIAPAQDKTPFRFVPADAQLVVRIAAPARWQSEFANTKVAKMLGGDAFAPWLAQGRELLDEGFEAARAGGEVDVDALQRFVREYRGELVIAAKFDFERVGAAVEAGEPPPFWVSMTLTPDGTSDLAAFATAITKSAEEDTELRDLSVGEHRFRAAEVQPGYAITLPAVVDGHLVVLCGADLAEHGARWLDGTDRMALAGDGASLWIHAELGGAIAALVEVLAAEADDQGLPFEVDQLVRDLGLTAIESFSASIAPDGERTAMEFTLGTKAEDRGLFDLVTADPDASKLLRYVPPGPDSYSATPFDLSALYAVAERCWKGLGGVVPITFDDAMAEFAEATKVRLKEDLLDHVGKGLLAMQDVATALTPETMAAAADDENMFGGMDGCYVFALRDGKAFGTSLETMLRARGLHAARKSEEYGGTKVHLLRLAGLVELEYAVFEDLLLIAIGEDAPRQHLRGVIDARRQGGNAELPKELAPYVAALPKGWVGLQASPIAATLGAVGRMFTMMEEHFGEHRHIDLRQAAQVLATLSKELERAGLGTMVGAVYVDSRQLKARTLW